MALSGGSEARASDVLALVASAAPTTFTTTTPAGSGWYRYLLGGALVEVHYESSGTVAGQTVVTITTLPAGYRPAGLTAVAASSASTKPSASDIASDGTWSIYNWNSSAAAVRCHGIYKPA